MSDMSDTTAVPAVRVFEFHGDQLPTMEVEGRPSVILRPMVEALGASWVGQVERLKRDPVLNTCVRVTRTQLPGDVQSREVSTLPVEMVPLFLAKISVNRVKPELREKLIRYQTECGKALYDYWFKGAAVRGDHEGVVTDLSPAVRQALGGIVKGIVVKALAEIVPALVREQVSSSHHAVVQGVSAGQVLEMAGVGKRKGLRGMAVWVSHRLRRFHAVKGVAVRIATLGSSNAYVFDPLTSREWLDGGGKVELEQRIAERRGQGALRLV